MPSLFFEESLSPWFTCNFIAEKRGDFRLAHSILAMTVDCISLIQGGD
jgi:hypothetical protein